MRLQPMNQRLQRRSIALLTKSQCADDCLRNNRGVADWSEVDKARAVGEFRATPLGDFECESRLTNATSADEREQPSAMQSVGDFDDLVLASDEAGQLLWQVDGWQLDVVCDRVAGFELAGHRVRLLRRGRLLRSCTTS